MIDAAALGVDLTGWLTRPSDPMEALVLGGLVKRAQAARREIDDDLATAIINRLGEALK